MKIKLFFLLLISIFILQCKKQDGKTAYITDSSFDENFENFVIETNSLKSSDRKKIYKNIDSVTAKFNQKSKSFYKDYANLQLAPEDSAAVYLKKIDTVGHSRNIKNFFEWYDLDSRIAAEGAVDIILSEKILDRIAEGEKRGNKWLYLYYESMAKILFNNRDYKKSGEYFTKFYNIHPAKNAYNVEQPYNQVSFLYAMKVEDLESMKYFQQKVEDLAAKNSDELVLATAMDYKSIVYSFSGKQDSAMVYSLKSFDYMKSLNRLNVVSFINISMTYLKNKKYDQAIKFAEDGLNFSFQNKDSANTSALYIAISEAYEGKEDFKTALKFYKLYDKSNSKDAEIAQNQKVAEIEQKYNAEKKNAEINILNQNNELNKKVILYQKSIIAGIVVITLALLSILYMFYRKNVNKNKARQLILENEKLKIEQKVLQLKLNPHFIFNTLSNFQGLVSNNKKEELLGYLGKFARLMRSILNIENDEFILIEEEIVILKDYLSLQEMRYGESFEYEIIIDDNCSVHSQYIPPMIIQPFIENSLMHGFRSIDYIGKIVITFKNKNNKLIISVVDNGVGEMASLKTDGKPSLATKIIQQRLNLLFDKSETFLSCKASVNGFEVIVGIPIINNV